MNHNHPVKSRMCRHSKGDCRVVEDAGNLLMVQERRCLEQTALLTTRNATRAEKRTTSTKCVSKERGTAHILFEMTMTRAQANPRARKNMRVISAMRKRRSLSHIFCLQPNFRIFVVPPLQINSHSQWERRPTPYGVERMQQAVRDEAPKAIAKNPCWH